MPDKTGVHAKSGVGSPLMGGCAPRRHHANKRSISGPLCRYGALHAVTTWAGGLRDRSGASVVRRLV